MLDPSPKSNVVRDEKNENKTICVRLTFMDSKIVWLFIYKKNYLKLELWFDTPMHCQIKIYFKLKKNQFVLYGAIICIYV